MPTMTQGSESRRSSYQSIRRTATEMLADICVMFEDQIYERKALERLLDEREAEALEEVKRAEQRLLMVRARREEIRLELRRRLQESRPTFLLPQRQKTTPTNIVDSPRVLSDSHPITEEPASIPHNDEILFRPSSQRSYPTAEMEALVEQTRFERSRSEYQGIPPKAPWILPQSSSEQEPDDHVTQITREIELYESNLSHWRGAADKAEKKAMIWADITDRCSGDLQDRRVAELRCLKYVQDAEDLRSWVNEAARELAALNRLLGRITRPILNEGFLPRRGRTTVLKNMERLSVDDDVTF